MKKLISKNIHEYDLTPSLEPKKFDKVRARFETIKNDEDIKIPYKIFERLSDVEEITKKQKLYFKYNIFSGRSGSVISIRDESYWTLELITRVNKRSSRKTRYSISSVIDTLLDWNNSSSLQDFFNSLTEENISDCLNLIYQNLFTSSILNEKDLLETETSLCWEDYINSLLITLKKEDFKNF